MAEETRQFPRSAIVDAVVLACTRTSLTDVVGPDAMHTAVNTTYLDMASDGVLELQPLWDLFAEQPGFDPEPALDAMCKVKSWEAWFRLKIRRPEAVKQLTLEEQNKRAKSVDVSDAELDKALGLHTETEAQAKPKAAGRPAIGGRQRLILIAGAVIALATFTVSGVFLYRNLGGPNFASVDGSKVAGDIPVTNVRKLGRQVNATLTDNAWLKLPIATRTAHLEEAFARLDETDGLLILDGKKVLRASITAAGSNTQVRFY